MATRKFIYWRKDLPRNDKDETYANIHLLVGYCPRTIAQFRNMADELRKTFPRATDDQIEGGKVFRSSFVDGNTIITWGAHIPKGDYPGWHQSEDGQMEYSW